MLCLDCICCTYYDYTTSITRMNCPKFGTFCYLLCTPVTVLTELFEVVKKACLKSDVHGSVHRKRISKYNQQDATLHNLFISAKCATCFRRFLRPSSGAQNCIYSIGYFVKPLLLPPTTVAGSSKGLTKYPMLYISSKGLTKYPMLYIQFWAPDDGRRNRLKHVAHFAEINKLGNVASCWLYMKIFIWSSDFAHIFFFKFWLVLDS